MIDIKRYLEFDNIKRQTIYISDGLFYFSFTLSDSIVNIIGVLNKGLHVYPSNGITVNNMAICN